MIKLAMEIPTKYLSELAPLCDLDFVLAHKVLQDTEYARFFAQRATERELILDNSTHEFGKPMEFHELRKAAELCRADFIIAPDIVPDVTRGKEALDAKQYVLNLQWLREASHQLGKFEIAGVVCGRDVHDVQNYFHHAALMTRTRMLCFTFHNPERLSEWDVFVEHPRAQCFDRIHLLGVSTLEELRVWSNIAKHLETFSFSVDTAKALKWGAQRVKIDEVESLRGGAIRSKEVLDLEHLGDVEMECVRHNIQVLKEICA